jgi:hypothetical protein
LAVLLSGTERLSKDLLVAKKKAQEAFYVLSHKTKVDTRKRHKGNTESIPAITDHNGKLIRNLTEKANSLNSYYES